MLIGRFLMMIPLLAAAGSLAQQETGSGFGRHIPHPRTAVRRAAGGRQVIVGALTFFPALSLGPIVEQFLMHSGKLFSCSCLGSYGQCHHDTTSIRQIADDFS